MNPLAVAPELLPNLIARLTPRQLEIVELLAQGNNNKEVASILSIRRGTVEGHIVRACQKLRLENRIQLIVVFVMWKVTN